jgi:hypothetical protein
MAMAKADLKWALNVSAINRGVNKMQNPEREKYKIYLIKN